MWRWILKSGRTRSLEYPFRCLGLWQKCHIKRKYQFSCPLLCLWLLAQLHTELQHVLVACSSSTPPCFWWHRYWVSCSQVRSLAITTCDSGSSHPDGASLATSSASGGSCRDTAHQVKKNIWSAEQKNLWHLISWAKNYDIWSAKQKTFARRRWRHWLAVQRSCPWHRHHLILFFLILGFGTS